MNKHIVRTLGLFLAMVLQVCLAYPQDLFEFQVYDADLVPKDGWEIDVHLVHIQKGTVLQEESVLPTEGQTHLAIETTRGFAEEFELGSYLLLARRADGRLDYAGVRLRPRFKAPERWGLPVGVSLSFEFGWPKNRYEADPFSLEIRPIIDKSIGRWTFNLNPVIAKSVRGPDAGTGFEFEPSAKIDYEVSENFLTVGLQYFGAIGPLKEFLPASQQTHILHPNFEFSLGKNTILNIGVGMGLTDVGERLLPTARLGLVF
jgi:hypothetical protein